MFLVNYIEYDIWYVNRVRKGWGDPIHDNSRVNSNQSEAFLYPGEKGGLFFTRFYSSDSSLLMHTRLMDNQLMEPQLIKNIGDVEQFSDRRQD